MNKNKEKAQQKQDISYLNSLRNSELIREKTFDEISSFNFTRNAFKKKIWNEQTTKARGLYLNNETGEVVCRGYNKFFSIDEMPESTMEYIKENYHFPLTAYVKENGYLGLLSYREKTDELFITTKSDPTGDFAKWFAKLLKDYDQKKIKKYVKENHISLLFEVIDVGHDPHIIKYDKNKLVLLDAVNNTIEEFERKSYDDLCKIAKEFGFEVKKKAMEFTTFDEFSKWTNEITPYEYKFDNEYIEGFVIEDVNGNMCKFKTSYYRLWKCLRGKIGLIKSRNLQFADIEVQDNIPKTSIMNEFLNWYCENRDTIDTNRVVEIREMFEKR